MALTRCGAIQEVGRGVLCWGKSELTLVQGRPGHARPSFSRLRTLLEAYFATTEEEDLAKTYLDWLKVKCYASAFRFENNLVIARSTPSTVECFSTS